MAGYKTKYIKTYLWSGLSFILSFLSMFIVAPLTTSTPEAYGVYSLCISFNIFLKYADLGFITAGRKYAAEAFSVNNHALEKKYVGTSMFIYGTMTMVFFLLTLLFATFPEIIIRDIGDSPYYNMAHQLLLILAFTFPLSIIQKFCGLIYSVRIEDYKIQSLQIVGSIIKIASVPAYFFNNRYDIVGYYLFCEVINLLINMYILIRSKAIGYGAKEFFSCFKIDKEVFNEIKPLALSGFASVIGWVTYYELDTVGVSILLGANAVAVYALGKQIQTFVRSLVGIVYSPYPVRINYYIGNKDFNGLKSFFYKLSEEFSIVIIPIVAIVLFAKPFIISWVGNGYEESVVILQLLVLTFVIHHVSSPASAVLYGLNKVKDILKLAFIPPIIFWVGIFSTFHFGGVNSFAVFKFLACVVTEFYYCYLAWKYLEYTKKDFYWGLLIKPLLIIGASCILFWYFSNHLLGNVTKGHQSLLYVAIVIGICCLSAFLIDTIFNKSLKNDIKHLLQTKRDMKYEK